MSDGISLAIEHMNFEKFKKISRLFRDVVITEKIDGTNAQVLLYDSLDAFDPYAIKTWLDPEKGSTHLRVGSRSQWIGLQTDNHGFARWAFDNADDLRKLGCGRHFAEWWGSGIQRGYGLQKGEKHFSLFNTAKWSDGSQYPCWRPERNVPDTIGVVPVLYEGPFDTRIVQDCLNNMRERGSYVAPGYRDPEGVVVFHTAANECFKVTIKNDEKPKSQVKSE